MFCGGRCGAEHFHGSLLTGFLLFRTLRATVICFVEGKSPVLIALLADARDRPPLPAATRVSDFSLGILARTHVWRIRQGEGGDYRELWWHGYRGGSY